MPDPSVTLVLKGLLAIFVNETKDECTVGILGSPPAQHNLKISFKKKPTAGGALVEARPPLEPPQIKNKLRLDVQNVSQTKITFRDPDAAINRHADPSTTLGANKTTFRWVVDLEGAEIYDGKIGAKKSAFNPILTFKIGELFTKSTSRSHLFLQRGIFSTEDFGFVANEIGVKVTLDQATSKAIFFNGGDAIPVSESATDFEIEINHDAAKHSGIVTDANHYYKAVGLGLSEEQRILFMSKVEDGGPAGPEAACFSAFLGRSQPEG